MIKSEIARALNMSESSLVVSAEVESVVASWSVNATALVDSLAASALANANVSLPLQVGGASELSAGDSWQVRSASGPDGDHRRSWEITEDYNRSSHIGVDCVRSLKIWSHHCGKATSGDRYRHSFQ